MLASLKAAVQAALRRPLVAKVLRTFAVASLGAVSVVVLAGGSVDKALLGAALAAGLRAVLHLLPVNDTPEVPSA